MNVYILVNHQLRNAVLLCCALTIFIFTILSSPFSSSQSQSSAVAASPAVSIPHSSSSLSLPSSRYRIQFFCRLPGHPRVPAFNPSTKRGTHRNYRQRSHVAEPVASATISFVLEYENLQGQRVIATPTLLGLGDLETGVEAARLLTSMIPLYLSMEATRNLGIARGPADNDPRGGKVRRDATERGEHMRPVGLM